MIELFLKRTSFSNVLPYSMFLTVCAQMFKKIHTFHSTFGETREINLYWDLLLIGV